MRINCLVLARLLYTCSSGRLPPRSERSQGILLDAARHCHALKKILPCPQVRIAGPVQRLASLLLLSNPIAGWQHISAACGHRYLASNLNCNVATSWRGTLTRDRHPVLFGQAVESKVKPDIDDEKVAVKPSLDSSSACCRNVTDMITEDLFDAAKVAAVEQNWTNKLTIEEFLQRAGLLGGKQKSTTTHIIDVRAPGEFAQGHIPGAISVPLFDDDERARVGTTYHKEGRDVAVARGLNIVTAKGFKNLLSSVPQVREGDELLVYCWRGGMRSGGMAQLLARTPLPVSTLAGGYKSYRNWALRQWEQDRDLVVVAGPTGSGKTDILEVLRDSLHQQVIDLEGDANHRGSAFGALGREAQPSNEHYENILALQWANFNASAPVFIEDEGVSVGRAGVPPGLWKRMRNDTNHVLKLEVPRDARVAKLVSEYGKYPPEDLAMCCKALTKRLGGEKVKQAVAWLEERPPRLAEVAELLLEHYYDGMYNYNLKKREGIRIEVPCSGGDALENAQRLLATFSEQK